MTESLAEPTLLSEDIKFPESPRWHAGALWFVDMVAGQVLKRDMDGRQTVVADVPGRATGLGFMPDGTPIVGSQLERKLFRIEPDGLTEFVDLSQHFEHPQSDLIVDSHGRTYVGSQGYGFFQDAEPTGSQLLRVDPDGTITKVADGLVFPNGLAISADGKTLYAAETHGHRIMMFDIEADGSLTNGRVYVDFGDKTPDGICLDAEGALWVGGGYEDLFFRVLPNGSIDETQLISCSGRAALAPVLGGPDGRTLFLTEGVATKEQMRRGETAGFLRAVEVPVPRGASLP